MPVMFPLPLGETSGGGLYIREEGTGPVQGSEACAWHPDTQSQEPSPETDEAIGLSFLILARNESEVLERSLAALRAGAGPADCIHVVADQSQDATADIARRHADFVYVRSEGGEPGKGPALRWWLEQTRNTHAPQMAVVVLDADSLLAPGFASAMRRRLARGEPAIQALVAPHVGEGGVIARLAAFSEIVEQHVFDAWYARRKWPVRLRGTGMVIQRWALEQAAPLLQTSVEDLELTLLLASEHVPITLASETWVIDPKPESASGAVRQRARWLKGQLHLLRAHPRPVWLLLLQGPPGWALLSSALLKPKALVVPVKILLTLLACLAADRRVVGALPLAAAGVAWLVVDVVGLLSGLHLVEDRKKTLQALLVSPVYLALWLGSLVVAVFSRDQWLRARPASRGRPEVDLGHAPDAPR